MKTLAHRRIPSPTKHQIIFQTASLLCLILCCIGCAVRLIGDYDDTIDQGVTQVQQKAELYLTKLKSNPSTPYDQSFYDDISARLAVLKSRAASLPKYPIVTEQLATLTQQFDTFQKLDQSSKRPFPAGAVTAAESAIAVSVESILKLELALKARGKPSPPGLNPQK